MNLSLAELCQLKRAQEQSSRPFRDLPGERPGNPNLLFRPNPNLFSDQLDLFRVDRDGSTEDDH
jgi:hypothetical protein